MFQEAIKQIKTAATLLALMTILTGLLYPALVTGIAQLFFPWQANGSLIQDKSAAIGSVLIGQYFDSPKYFWGRPSATSPFPYNAANSSGSNMGPSNTDFLATVNQRAIHLRSTNSPNNALVPVDLVTASGSGLDPEISPLAALYQTARIAKARSIPEQEVKALVNKLQKNRTFHLLGEPRINVLELNLALDQIQPNP
ncbi:MAG: potassium-transporting ATPase subunit KdpC [Legionellales bacterium]